MKFHLTDLDPHEFRIRETNDDTGLDARSAWSYARAQTKPVAVYYQNTTVKRLGKVFDPARFELVLYACFITNQVAVKGKKAKVPEFGVWAVSFRENCKITWPVPEYVEASLPEYKRLLKMALRKTT